MTSKLEVTSCACGATSKGNCGQVPFSTPKAKFKIYVNAFEIIHKTVHVYSLALRL